MDYRPARFIACLSLAALSILSIGCGGRRLEDPPQSFKKLQNQDYDFETVWEVVLEAMRELNFKVREKERSGDDRQALIISEMLVAEPVAFEGTEKGERLRVEIGPASGSAHSITVAASRWKRQVRQSDGPGFWEFVDVHSELQGRFEAKLEEQFAKRYQRKNPN